MFNMVLNMSWILNLLGVLNVAWLYMQRLHRVLNMAHYASIMLEYGLISLSMSEHGGILLNVPEYA